MTTTDASTRICPTGHPVGPDQTHCGHCGRRIATPGPTTCTAGHENPDDFRFCGQCGLRLDPDRAEAPDVTDLNEVLTVELVEQTLIESDDDDESWTRIASTLRYTNHTDHDIAAFTGGVLFLDVFERPQFGSTLTVDLVPVPAHSSVLDDSLGHDICEGRPDHTWLVAHVDGPATFVWVPEAVLLADGTLLGEIAPPEG